VDKKEIAIEKLVEIFLNQKKLEPDFIKILNENFWELLD